MPDVERLTLHEVRLLKPWTQKLEMLERGEFPANTTDRRHFLQVCRGEVEPQTELERAYLKWRVGKPDLDLLEADLVLIARKARRLEAAVRSARETRGAAVQAEKDGKRVAKVARLEAARRERRKQKEIARRNKT
jgi:hypothetical protein